MKRPPVTDKRLRESRFFIAMALAMTLVVFIGFARSFFLSFLWRQPAPDASSEPIFYVHGTIFTVWMALLIAQPTLIKNRQVNTHRRLGLAGAVVAAGVVLIGIAVCLVAAARPATSALPPLALDFLGVLVSGMVIFGLLVGLAVTFRRDGQTHKRLMLLASVNLLPAAVVRIPLPGIYGAGPVTTFLLAYVFILPLAVWDFRALGRVHPATVWGGLAIVVSLPLRLWLSSTQMWLTVAENAVGLVN